jgi:hypothetical protein
VAGLRDLLAPHRRMYGASGAAYRTDIRDDDKIIEVGMPRLPDRLVRDMRSVEITRVDVIDAALYGFPEYGDGCRFVSRSLSGQTPKARRVAPEGARG